MFMCRRGKDIKSNQVLTDQFISEIPNTERDLLIKVTPSRHWHGFDGQLKSVCHEDGRKTTPFSDDCSFERPVVPWMVPYHSNHRMQLPTR